MSPALNESSAIQCFEGSNTIKICDGITFDFYTGLPQIEYLYMWQSRVEIALCRLVRY